MADEKKRRKRRRETVQEMIPKIALATQKRNRDSQKTRKQHGVINQ